MAKKASKGRKLARLASRWRRS